MSSDFWSLRPSLGAQGSYDSSQAFSTYKNEAEHGPISVNRGGAFNFPGINVGKLSIGVDKNGVIHVQRDGKEVGGLSQADKNAIMARLSQALQGCNGWGDPNGAYFRSVLQALQRG